MKKIFISFSICLLGYAVFAAPTGTVQICDTLFNLASPKDTPEVYTYSTPDTGYISGNNSYGDKAKAESFIAAVGGVVNGAYLSFGHVSINTSDSNSLVKVYLWANNSGPGAIVDSGTVTFSAIAAEVAASNIAGHPQFVYVSFSGTPLPTQIFYVGVELPTVEGDTVALFTSSSHGAHDGKGWEQYGTGAWHQYSTENEFGNFIKAAICATGSVPSAAFGHKVGCTGATVLFADSSTNMPYTWYWLFPNGSPTSATIQNASTVYGSVGSYPVTLIATNFFGSDTTTDTINVYESPSYNLINKTDATNGATANGSITVAGISGTPPYSYSWTWTGGADTGAMLSNILPGNYKLSVTDSVGCSSSFQITLASLTGIYQISDNNQVKIYPNPATDQLNIKWSSVPNAQISIMDLSGRTIKEFIDNNSVMSVFDVHDLPSGSYIIRITDRSTNQQQSAVFNKL